MFKKCLLYLIFLCSLGNSAFGGIKFIPNGGQWDPAILYRAELTQGYLLVGKNKLAYMLYDNSQLFSIHDRHLSNVTVNGHSLVIEFDGANPNSFISVEQPTSEYYNFYLGNDKSKWASGLHGYDKLTIKDVYNDIDFELLEDNGTLKYNFIVKPYADPTLVKLKYIGATFLSIVGEELHIGTSLTEIIELKPLVYQESGDEKEVIASSYKIDGNVLTFELSGKRKRSKQLVIDPVLVFSTYSGSKRDNFGFTATYDHLGNGYAGGAVYRLGTTFPTTPGAFQSVFKDGIEDHPNYTFARDCGISKYSSDGKTLLYCTYLGGTNNEQPHSLIVNKANELIVFGTTKSIDFPIDLNSNGYDVFHNGMSDIFVIRFNVDGTKMLTGTYFGGTDNDGLNGDISINLDSKIQHNYADDFRGEVQLDANENVYIASCTNSDNLPKATGPNGSKIDGIVIKLSPDMSQLFWSTYIYGNGDDAAYGIAFGSGNDMFVTGGTSDGLLNSMDGLNKNFLGGTADGFLMHMSSVDGSVINGTYVGTIGYDQSYMVQTDKYGFPFVYGQTTGDFPVNGNVYSNTKGRQFIAKFSKDVKLMPLSTIFGGGRPVPDISPTSFLVDECERIFVSGWGGNTNEVGGNTKGMPISSNALQKTTDGSDFYLAVFSKNLEEFLYGTYFGGNLTEEHVDGGTSRFDTKGVVYQSVCSDCNSQHTFPTTSGARFPTNPSPRCSNALFKIDFESFNRKPIVSDTLLFVTATDTLIFDYIGYDKDRYDSLQMNFSGPAFGGGSVPAPYIKITGSTSEHLPLNKITTGFIFTPGCQHVTGDTLKIKVRIYDRGCPTADSNFAVIKILVLPPPLSTVPAVICLNFNDDGSIKLRWDGFEKNKYFKDVILYRINPNSTIKTLDTIKSNEPAQLTDKTVVNAKVNGYCYYFVGRNICNKTFNNGYKVCSDKEFESPIDSTYLITGTVVENKNILTRWFKSRENDFGSYLVYRSLNVGKPIWKLVKSISAIEDTTWIDTDVKVQTTSYCYQIVVADLCNHISRQSNKACNIVLTGESLRYYFNVGWTPYNQWKGGVNSYSLSRRVDTGILRPLVVKKGDEYDYTDRDLDYWWGGYNYRITGFEGKNTAGEGFDAWSESNDLYMIQPPLLHVPNAFTPGSDGINDMWGFVPAFVKDFNMQVFDRWGQKVFDTDFKGQQWDGKTLGDTGDNDVFIWLATYKGWDGRRYNQKGTVTVLR